ncbi:MAG TPA: class I SAM-dependent methyltransferase [Pseudomonadota bacterium]|nr:class I SAM-dependent methyltransferase [Pseudomonadota bacterium]
MRDAVPPTEYDAVPYPCGGHDYTHPGHLAMLATLFGLSAPPVATCRVLELGCGDGSNLIPMALAMPNATFVGIDLSARHIETGQQEVSQLGISNLSLRHQDLLTFGDGEQPFDYIIGHGIYSWVPEAVRSKIWDICSNLLSPHGVAYLSYNTYPGWHQRKMVRDMMRFHTQRLDDPDRRRAQALAMVNFIAGAVPSQFPLHRKALETELARLTELPRNYILHDDLGEINQPYYFHEFITAATAHGLQFLSETRFHVMQDNRLSPEARNTLRQVGDLLVMEQYRDYITCSAFRETLICHATRSLERRIQPSQMERFSFQSSLRSQSAQPDVVHAVDEKFQSDGMTLSLSEPIAKAALVIMQQNAPKAIPFETLFADSLRLCRADSQADFDLRFRMNQRQELSELLLAGFGAGVIRPTLFQAPFCLRPGDKPQLEPLARLRMSANKEVTTPLLDNIRFDEPFGRAVALLCTGQRSRSDMVTELSQRIAAGEFPSELSGGSVPSPEALHAMVKSRLTEVLDRIARYGILVEN